VFAAVSRFWRETCHYDEPLGEVEDIAVRIRNFQGVAVALAPGGAGVADVVARLSSAENMILRAEVVRYYRVAKVLDATESPLPFGPLNELLLELNLALNLAGYRTQGRSRGQQPGGKRRGPNQGPKPGAEAEGTGARGRGPRTGGRGAGARGRELLVHGVAILRPSFYCTLRRQALLRPSFY